MAHAPLGFTERDILHVDIFTTQSVVFLVVCVVLAVLCCIAAIMLMLLQLSSLLHTLAVIAF